MSTKVDRIEVSNIMAIASKTADFKGCSALVMAGNHKGKTTLLSLLSNRLRGIRPELILKQGEEEGFYKMTLTDGTRFEWPIDAKKKGDNLSEIKIITKDGIKAPVTKEIAQRYFPALFSVDEFLSARPQVQQKMLEKIGGVDLDDVNAMYKAAFEERKHIKRTADEAEARLNPVNSSLPKEELPTLEIQQEIAGIELHNHKHQNAVKGVNELKKALTDQETEIKRLKTLLKTAEAEHTSISKRITDGEKWVNAKDNQPKGDDIHFELSQKLQKAIDDNKLVAENNKAIAAKEAFKEIEKKADEADKLVKSIDAERNKLIKSAKLPADFGFVAEGEGILYKGLPFTRQQQSTSDLYIAAIKLGVPSLGEVKMMHMDISTLDNENVAAIEAFAKENDLQILLERPRLDGGDITYELIEDIK